MRITGGTLRSRPLRAPRGASTRPTSDRVREALFSILASRCTVAGARVLDLYAGTGALGLEALSRGAAHATFVERGKDAVLALRNNIASLDVTARARVVVGSVDRAASLLGVTLGDAGASAFDLIFADPPYADVPTGSVARALAALASAELISFGGCVVLEHAHADAPPDVTGLTRGETRRYGDTALTFYEAPARRAAAPLATGS